MKNLVIMFGFSLFFGCSDNTQEQFNFDVGFELSVKDNEGNNLLDPNYSNSFKEDEIKLYYLINGIKEEVFNSNLDNPRNFRILKYEENYRIGITQNHSDTEIKSVTYIEWNQNDTDTIESTYRRTSNAIIQENVWFNGKLIQGSETGLFMEIIK